VVGCVGHAQRLNFNRQRAAERAGYKNWEEMIAAEGPQEISGGISGGSHGPRAYNKISARSFRSNPTRSHTYERTGGEITPH
jgi:hypothetical protein